MTNAVVGALGAALGLAAHDLAIGALADDRPLRPLRGVCPGCGYERGWRRVRCPECGRAIRREPVVTVVSALVAVGFANTVGATWLLVPFLGFLGLSTALLVTDLEAYRIVDRLNIRGTLAAAALLAASALAVSDPAGLLRGLAGAAVYFAGAVILWLVVRGRGFGAGDVKLAVQLGLFTAFVSWTALAWAVFATAMIGGVVAVGLVATGAAGMKTELPYGPPMILGAWLAIILAGLTSA